MEVIKEYVIILVATIMFMTATELIAPDNSMKKYVKYVLGLIFISVLLTPIIKFFTGGEKIMTEAIDDFQVEIDSLNVVSGNVENSEESRKKNFINSYNNECEKLLKDKFDDMDFKCELECNVDFNNMTYTVNKLVVEVCDNSIKQVEKIDINKEAVKKTDNKSIEIENYLSKELEISKDKIEVISM